MKIELIGKLIKEDEILTLFYTAAKTCVSEIEPKQIYEKNVSIETKKNLISRVINAGHLSILEHFTMTFSLYGVSRSLLAQLTRHRVGIAYSVMSQRYVRTNFDKLEDLKENFVIPSTISRNKEAIQIFEKALYEVSKTYSSLLEKGIPAEDARFILPNAMKTNLVFSVNFRELMHICSIRLCAGSAQWEIYELFSKIKEIITKISPFLGNFLQPQCYRLQYCPESSERCCGLFVTKNSKE